MSRDLLKNSYYYKQLRDEYHELDAYFVNMYNEFYDKWCSSVYHRLKNTNIECKYNLIISLYCGHNRCFGIDKDDMRNIMKYIFPLSLNMHIIDIHKSYNDTIIELSSPLFSEKIKIYDKIQREMGDLEDIADGVKHDKSF